MDKTNDQQLMKQMLQDTETIAVIGLSDKKDRTSYQIARAMQQQGYRIIPVNPNVNEVLGEKAYKSVVKIDKPFQLINIFRKSVYLQDIAKEIVQTDAPYVWMQQGVKDDKACQYLQDHDKKVIMDQCIKVAHSMLMK
ncbi:hypothetical protein J416_07852 [Gracilibacillus halophilus YIM-C55.5]|uniref:CoA-binding domain-containing protein n=1 Tax=Gracilibacillus halophilus YIM-C55.5 TaxID=1308866 RepID=N4WV60_9BACI|nr:CoA-binding protein [Gracilibacillus halophilus]ENH96976.1 hypothetical protein J416_07852 [Gracilibacillus halophilus YIM-C55.5]